MLYFVIKTSYEIMMRNTSMDILHQLEYPNSSLTNEMPVGISEIQDQTYYQDITSGYFVSKCSFMIDTCIF